jgi:NAD(P)-dependent dehydrogenase (short-subunit alcohol dehydrogenase family)
MSNQDHQNKIYLVTGGTTGIGAATAALLSESGAKVIVTGRDEQTLKAARESAPANVEVVASDAGDLSAITQLAAHVSKKYGRLDGAFLNAGVAPFLPLEAWDESAFDRLYAINVKGPFFLAQKLVPMLSKGAALVFNTSVVAEVGMGAASAYGGTKGALRSIVRSLSVELAPRGVRVNAVSPGPIETPIYGKMGMSPEQLQGFSKHMGSRVPLARLGKASDIANAVAFLLSERASFITGDEIAVDGGLRNNVS